MVLDLFLVDFRSTEKFSALTRIYVCKWRNISYQLQMAISLSLLGPRTNLIDRKGSILNGEKGDVFGLWSKIYFWLIFDSF